MLDLAAATMDREPVRIVDPGAGVGAFTLAAAKRWPKASVFAVDVNVVTLGLLAARIAFEIDVESEDAEALSRVHLELDDYLHDLGDRFRHARGPVLVLGNPPYTRIQELPIDYRSTATALCGEIVDNGHANLAILFQAATLNHMRAEDASCMVLPGSVSFTRAGLGLRQALWRSERPVTVQRTPATTRPFSGRSVQAAIILVGPVNARRPPIQFARVRFGTDAPEMLEKWEGDRDGVEPTNWFLRKVREDNSSGFALSEIAAVQRGVATGASTMFFLTDTQAERLSRDVIVPAVPTLRRFSAQEMDAVAHATWGDTHTKRWLLAIPRDYRLDGPLRVYVQQFEAEVRGRFLVSQRKPWYSITNLPQPDILIAPLSKNDFKIVINTVRAVPGIRQLMHFGVLFGPRRVVIYVKPDDDQEMTPNTARSQLLANGEPLPWEDWAAEFRNKLPDEIKRMMEELLTQDSDGNQEEAIRQRLKRIEDLMRTTRYRRNPAGSANVSGNATGGSAGEGETEETTRKRPPGGAGGRASDLYGAFVDDEEGGPADPVNPKPQFPEIRWVSVANGTRSVDDNLEDRAASYVNSSQNVLLVNEDFRVYTDLVTHFVRQYEGYPGVEKTVPEVIKEWYAQQLVEAVLGLLSVRGSAKWPPNDVEKALSEEALTSIVMLRYNLYQQVSRVLGTRLGSLKDKAETAAR
jgi:hypothetical protein